MLQVFIAIILILFLGLFVLLSLSPAEEDDSPRHEGSHGGHLPTQAKN